MNKKRLNTPNTWPVRWHAKLIDTGDGSGDAFIELPDDLLHHLGWKLGDIIELDLDKSNQINKVFIKHISSLIL